MASNNSAGLDEGGRVEDDSYSPGFVIGVTVCLGLAALVGFIGNGLIVAVMCRTKKLRSVMNRFILHLAIGDLMVTALCIPLFVAINFFFDQNNRVWICKVARFLQYLASEASMTLLITIGINRHRAIVHPLNAMTFGTANRMILGAWLYAVIMVSPSLYLTEVQYYKDPFMNSTRPYCATIPVSNLLGKIYVMSLGLLGYLLPLLVLVVLYGKISHAVWNRNSGNSGNLRTSRPMEVMLRSRKKVIKMFLTVIVVFVVTWLPLLLYVGVLESYLYKSVKRVDQVRLVLYGIGLSNSLCNPFIYSFFNARFREGCKGIFKDSFRFIKRPTKSLKTKANDTKPEPAAFAVASNLKILYRQGGLRENTKKIEERNIICDKGNGRINEAKYVHQSSSGSPEQVELVNFAKLEKVNEQLNDALGLSCPDSTEVVVNKGISLRVRALNSEQDTTADQNEAGKTENRNDESDKLADLDAFREGVSGELNGFRRKKLKLHKTFSVDSAPGCVAYRTNGPMKVKLRKSRSVNISKKPLDIDGYEQQSADDLF